MQWNGRQFFHIPSRQFSSISIATQNLPFHTKVFFHILYQQKFRPEATRNLYCTFATLSVPLQVAADEGKHQYGTMHLIL